jgi:hypothetical protein
VVIYIPATADWTVGAQLTLREVTLAASLPAGQLLPTIQPTVELCPCAADGAKIGHLLLTLQDAVENVVTIYIPATADWSLQGSVK